MVEYKKKKIVLQSGGTLNFYYKVSSNGKKKQVSKKEYLEKKGGMPKNKWKAPPTITMNNIIDLRQGKNKPQSTETLAVTPAAEAKVASEANAAATIQAAARAKVAESAPLKIAIEKFISSINEINKINEKNMNASWKLYRLQKVIESNYENITKFSKDNGADLRFLLNKQKAIEKIEKKERNHSIWINPPQYRNWRNPPQYR